ncbi:DUF4148 domain-containing protein [Rhodoferax sp.]|uniref:DUF4148 domain-containing protein n=1 Tax=Rhodoferax sp. TaxID=50421 RepID=UPI001A017E28|nr:DUF4148 domain-containing protein [Rhodoferax sp.]MBE0474138.1 DUF4148 domain-containing protein [Rhodoferax sp.]
MIKAELAQAIRTGTMPVGDQGISMRDLHPDQYPATGVQAAKTRAQVESELAAAIRTGNYPVGDQGVMCNELHPDMHPTM